MLKTSVKDVPLPCLVLDTMEGIQLIEVLLNGSAGMVEKMNADRDRSAWIIFGSMLIGIRETMKQGAVLADETVRMFYEKIPAEIRPSSPDDITIEYLRDIAAGNNETWNDYYARKDPVEADNPFTGIFEDLGVEFAGT